MRSWWIPLVVSHVLTLWKGEADAQPSPLMSKTEQTRLVTAVLNYAFESLSLLANKPNATIVLGGGVAKAIADSDSTITATAAEKGTQRVIRVQGSTLDTCARSRNATPSRAARAACALETAALYLEIESTVASDGAIEARLYMVERLEPRLDMGSFAEDMVCLRLKRLPTRWLVAHSCGWKVT